MINITNFIIRLKALERVSQLVRAPIRVCLFFTRILSLKGGIFCRVQLKIGSFSIYTSINY
jgi:hypothetical protein